MWEQLKSLFLGWWLTSSANLRLSRLFSVLTDWDWLMFVQPLRSTRREQFRAKLFTRSVLQLFLPPLHVGWYCTRYMRTFFAASHTHYFYFYIRQGCFVFAFVWLFVCLSVHRITQKVVSEFWWIVWGVNGTSHLTLETNYSLFALIRVTIRIQEFQRNFCHCGTGRIATILRYPPPWRRFAVFECFWFILFSLHVYSCAVDKT